MAFFIRTRIVSWQIGFYILEIPIVFPLRTEAFENIR